MEFEQEYKKPLSVEEQIKYLKENKNVVFEKISEDEALIILRKYNYINVITPYKFIFAKKDNNQNVIRDNNKHIYNNSIDFESYWRYYKADKNQSTLLDESIFEFESVFNSTISQYIIKRYDFCDKKSFKLFISKIESINKKKLQCKNRYSDTLKILEENIDAYKSPYIAFDRLSLGQLLTLYELLNYEDQKAIYSKLKCLGEDIYVLFCNGRIKDFIQKVHIVNQIRNCTYHNNNLTILLNYRDVKKNDYRTKSDKISYKNIIKKMLNYQFSKTDLRIESVLHKLREYYILKREKAQNTKKV